MRMHAHGLSLTHTRQSICEQFNSFTARFKQLSLHLTWERSCHLLQFFIWKVRLLVMPLPSSCADSRRSGIATRSRGNRDIACGRRFGAVVAAAVAAAAAASAPAAVAAAAVDIVV
jgi:hypothetical protein